ncbi:MAG: hypothetical protein NTY88_05635 [Bacteroidetes bacterium]|nr:hypothetical protein [Bacteroidota bacterium]
MRFIILFLLFAAAICFSPSCNKMPNGGVPFYMRMDSAKVTFPSVGDNGIKDVWVEANSTNLGAYEMPCNFPVLATSTVRFVVSAGVYESGQSSVRVIYPFYQPDTFTITATNANQYAHHPSFSYKTGATFPFPNETFSLASGFGAKMQRIDTLGISFGRITAQTDSNVEAAQINTYALPFDRDVWLEFDYKSEVPFYTGFYGSYLSGASVVRFPVLFLTPRDNWTKIYLKLADQINAVRADKYNLFFEALRPYGSAGGSVSIDNVKLVYL